MNNSFQALRDRERLSLYLLEINGKPLDAEKAAVPVDLAEAYFDLQDILSEPEGQSKMAAFRQDLEAQAAANQVEWSRIAEDWDRNPEKAPLLEKLKAVLTKQRYLKSMIADLTRKM